MLGNCSPKRMLLSSPSGHCIKCSMYFIYKVDAQKCFFVSELKKIKIILQFSCVIVIITTMPIFRMLQDVLNYSLKE